MRQARYRSLRRFARRKKGMTLTEIMIVVIIIAMVSAAAVGIFVNRLRAAEETTAQTDARTVATTVEQYLIENRGSDCPDMQELVDSGFMNERRRTTDPWGNDFVIECHDDTATVISSGRDGQSGTDDDISSDEE
jgi:prepilin-type N-terminal cleavage/methylation domain-containing protein